MMKVLKFYILYRLPITVVLIGLGVLGIVYKDPISAWICFSLAFVSLLLYFMMGTMRLVQEAVSEGDVDQAMVYLKMIKFPRLLLKPIRAGYYMLQSNLSLASNDLSTAEASIRKSLNTKSSLVGDVKGTNLMQLGFIQLKKGNAKEARATLLEAIKAGIPDNDSQAAVYLQLASLEIQRNQNKVGKEYFRRAKALKPKAAEIVDQLKQMEKHVARIPG
jgi:tetratricopeptide (TPR) repeat protein